jgi:arylsulfatase A-like enzyme
LHALYDGGVRYVDDMLGRWIAEWRESGLLDRSLLVVTSDHGENFGEHAALMRGHGSVYEEGLAIPLLLRLPHGARGGERPDAMVSLIDVVPTVQVWIGLPAEPLLPGTSLLGALPEARAVHGQNYRLIASLRWPLKLFRSSEERGAIAVTQLDSDPEESDLETLDADAREALYAEHPAYRPPWIGQPPFPAAVPLSGENPLLDELQDLGYTGEH